MPAIGTVATSAEAYVERQRLAESHYIKGEQVSAVGVLTDAAAQFSEGRFPTTAVELLQRIVDDQRDASALRTVAEACLEHGERSHLAAAVRLLGMAHEHDRTDLLALELLARAFEKMGLEEKARKVEAVLVEIAEEEPTLPMAAARPLSRSDPGQ